MRHELREFSQEVQRRGGYSINRRNLIQQVGQPHELGVIGHIRAPYRIVDKFATDGDFVTDRFLAIVHDRGTDVEVLVECVIQIQAQQCFALHAEGGLVLERYTDVGTGIDDTLVGDGHGTHRVVHGVVAVLGKRHTTGSHNN